MLSIFKRRSEPERSNLWIDNPGAAETLDSMRIDASAKEALRALMTDGIAVIQGANDPELCRSTVADYQRYLDSHRDYVAENLDELGREKRLVNFHLWSDAATRIATNKRIMTILDCLFETETCVYTSLTFKYGTQQPVHRDTPHFATWPPDRFVGVWTALEDVHPEAGPLFYHAGGHRFKVDPQPFLDEAIRRAPGAPIAEQLLTALDLYNGEVIRTAPTISAARTLELKTGDTVIWHPQLPHGGSPALDPNKTRMSMVVHCAPANVQVHQHDAFFLHKGPEAPASRYGYTESNHRKIAKSGVVAFM